MGIFSTLFSTSAVEPITAVGNLVDAIFTSDEERLDKELVKQRLAMMPQLAQSEINKVQASHRSTFVAGARPFLMWVCGMGFAMVFILNPLFAWVSPATGLLELPVDVLLELTLAMLGLSSLRTMEKLKGVSK